MKLHVILLSSIVAFVLMAGPAQVVAQQQESGMTGPGSNSGMMMRDGMPGPGGMMGMMNMMGMMSGCPMMSSQDGQTSTFAAGRIAFLKAELTITDAQKDVWDAYAEAIKRNLQSMQSMRQMMKTVFEARTPVERLDAHINAMESRLTALKNIKPALEKLYSGLTDDQKKKADEILTGMGCMM